MRPLLPLVVLLLLSLLLLSQSAMAQIDEPESRIVDQSADAGTQGTNDLKYPPPGPDAVHVGICTGTDINEKEILLLDRLCLNRAGVVLQIATLDDLKRERDGLITDVNRINKELASEKTRTSGINPVVAIIVAIGAAALTGAIVGVAVSAAHK